MTTTRDFLAEAKFYEGYSRYNEETGQYETWNEAVDRVMNTHKRKYSHLLDNPEFNEYLELITRLYKERKILGSQRALQFGGDQLLKHEAKLYNCLSSVANRPSFFNEFFYFLLCGCGVGYSIQKHHVEQLPRIHGRKKVAKTFVIEDSIEGWSDSIAVLLSSFFENGGLFPEFEGKSVYFDFSKIRPKGAKISGGFLAPGPEPLRLALGKIESLLVSRVEFGFLRPIDVYDICCHIADSVLSGGVRRSATIALFSKDDEEMLAAKIGNWNAENPQRARSNNSVVLKRDETTYEDFQRIMEFIREYGEPGFVFVDNIEHTFNPCFSGDTIVAVADGRNGVSIEELAKENKPFPVYSGRISIRGDWTPEIKTAIAFKTGTRKTIKVTLSDGTSFICTPEHKLAIPGGHYIEAKDSLDVELQGFFTHKEKNYRLINSFSNGHAKQHRLIWEHFNGKIKKGLVVDHIKSGSPDFIDNLQIMTKKEHDAKTGEEFKGDKNPIHSIKDSVEWRKNRSNAAFLENNPRFSGITNEEIISNARLLKKWGMKISFSNLRKIDPRTPKTFSKNRFNGSIKYLRDIVNNISEYVEPVRTKRVEKETQENQYNNPIVVSIEDHDIVDVYDLKVEENSNFYILTSYDDNFMNSTGILVHNCLEIGMYTEMNGEYGFQGCNLVEQNGDKVDSEETFYEMCRASSALATLQAGYTNFRYVGEITKKIFEREALLGVSLTGWANSPDILLRPEVMRKGAEIVKETNKEVAKLIGINPAARTTCVKPAGNASTLLGSAPATQGEHSPRYFRLTQMNKLTPVAKAMVETNPYMVEESVWSSGKTDYVIYWPIISPKGSIYKRDLNGVKFLEMVKSIQENWVMAGKNPELCVDPTLSHNVSNTTLVNPEDWEEVMKFVFDNKESFTGVSFIGASGDKDYAQAPYTEVKTPNKIVATYGDGAMFASGLIVDSNTGFRDLWEACYIARFNGQECGEMKDIQSDWIRRFIKFADTFFDGDQMKAEYCLKDVHLLHKWNKITKNLKVFDFREHLREEVEIDVDTMGAQVCSPTQGCEI